MRYLVMITGQRTEEFTDVEMAMEYATRLVYLSPNENEEARERLGRGWPFSYSYGFNEAVITPWSEEEGGAQ